MLNQVLLLLAIALTIFFAYVAARPAAFSISRTAVIPAPPANVFALVNDFRQWDRWSPWAKLDPNSKATFDGAASGVGAKFAWSGNNKVGAGNMAITESRPHELIKLDLNFTRPMTASNVTVFTFQPAGNGTRVTWTMAGNNNFVGKLFNVFVNCDKMVGGQFEQGFANMAAVVSGAAKV